MAQNRFSRLQLINRGLVNATLNIPEWLNETDKMLILEMGSYENSVPLKIVPSLAKRFGDDALARMENHGFLARTKDSQGREVELALSVKGLDLLEDLTISVQLQASFGETSIAAAVAGTDETQDAA